MPEIVVLCGIPCSGKSSWASTVQEILPYRIISRDTIRTQQAGGNYVYNQRNENRVTAIADAQYDLAVQAKRDIILDNTHCKPGYLDIAIKHKPAGYSLKVIFFDCPLWKAYIRNVKRWLQTGKWIPVKVIKNMKKNYDKIDQSKYARTF